MWKEKGVKGKKGWIEEEGKKKAIDLLAALEFVARPECSSSGAWELGVGGAAGIAFSLGGEGVVEVEAG